MKIPDKFLTANTPLFREVTQEKIPSQTSIMERNILYWLAKECYEGVGEIIDLGTGVGGTTHPLCCGLKNNYKLKKIPKV